MFVQANFYLTNGKILKSSSYCRFLISLSWRPHFQCFLIFCSIAGEGWKELESIRASVLNGSTHFSTVLHFILKPVIWCAQHIKWLVSIRNATLDWNGLSAASKKTREHVELPIKCFAMEIEYEYLQDDQDFL